MKSSDIPLVRGGKLTPEIIEWIEKVSKVFPGVEKDMVIIRKPIVRNSSSALLREAETGGNPIAQEDKDR